MGNFTKKIDFKLESTPTIIMACFALHNFCERNKQGIDGELLQIQQTFQRNVQKSQKNIADKIYSGNTAEGIVIRNLLTEYVRQNLPDCY